MKTRIAGVFMALLFCISMVGGSFATSPQEVTKISGSNYVMEITGLHDYDVKAGKDVKITGTLKQLVAGVWWAAIYRYMDIDIIDSHGVVKYSHEQINNGVTGQVKFDIDTKKLSLNPGVYTIKVSYGGDPKNHLNPCEATSKLTVNS